MRYSHMKVMTDTANGLCIEEFCGRKPEEFFWIRVNDMNCYLLFCKEHAEKYQEMRDMELRSESKIGKKYEGYKR